MFLEISSGLGLAPVVGVEPRTTLMFSLVGAGRFERPTPCAQGRCATRLRYAPTSEASSILEQRRATYPDGLYQRSASSRTHAPPSAVQRLMNTWPIADEVRDRLRLRRWHDRKLRPLKRVGLRIPGRVGAMQFAADVGPEFAQNIAARIHTQRNSARQKTVSHGPDAGGLPKARDQAAPERAGDLTRRYRLFSGCSLSRVDRGNQGVP
jgi:hypothetical protein